MIYLMKNLDPTSFVPQKMGHDPIKTGAIVPFSEVRPENTGR